MRFNLKILLAVITILAFFTTVTWWGKCSDPQLNSARLSGAGRADIQQPNNAGAAAIYPQELNSNKIHVDEQHSPDSYSDIECLINDEFSISCRREGNEVYVPFSFIQKYFEIDGKVATYDGFQRFEWQHSYSKVAKMNGVYNPHGVFMSFENYNVEIRDRVKCISGKDGVPISTQWGPQGYFYPIQIAQFGLSHYSKNITEREPVVVDYLDSTSPKASLHLWKLPEKSSRINEVFDAAKQRNVFEFQSSDSLKSSGISIKLDHTADVILSLNVIFTTNGSVSVTLQMRDTKDIYKIHFVQSNTMISVIGNDIFYGIGARTRWTHFIRDLFVDLQKGLLLNSKFTRKVKLKNVKVLSLTLRGSGRLDGLSLATSRHLDFFFHAADWLVRNQDSQGGWPIDVARTLISGVMELPPGWYSAMAQGQAISVLTRAYFKTQNKKYLDAATSATRLFKIRSEDHGIVALFMDKYVWYEEYPTTPSSFVLNGFIYSLIGLYDLQRMCEPQADTAASVCGATFYRQVSELYRDGMTSLKVLLPMFDTGSGSIYDLRHVILGVAPNLARWDYHTTHINQLLLLSTIDDAPVLKDTAKRWIEYTKGRRAKHN